MHISDSEGLLKLWTLKTSTCEKTFEAHQSKAWALAVHPNEELIVSGGADSTLITWKVSICLRCVWVCVCVSVYASMCLSIITFCFITSCVIFFLFIFLCVPFFVVVVMITFSKHFVLVYTVIVILLLEHGKVVEW